MAVYTSNAYNVEEFEIDEASISVKQQKKVKNYLTRVAPRSDRAKKNEEFLCLKRSVLLMIISALVFLIISLQVYPKAISNELVRKINKTEAAIATAEAENVRLNSELNKITSIAKIDNYATEVLGMTKVENYQVEYIDLSAGDKVIYTAAGIDE